MHIAFTCERFRCAKYEWNAQIDCLSLDNNGPILVGIECTAKQSLSITHTVWCDNGWTRVGDGANGKADRLSESKVHNHREIVVFVRVCNKMHNIRKKKEQSHTNNSSARRLAEWKTRTNAFANCKRSAKFDYLLWDSVSSAKMNMQIKFRIYQSKLGTEWEK